MSTIAYARLIQQWADGSATLMEVGTRVDGPDAADEMVRRVKDLWHECVEDAEAEAEAEAGDG